jgi:purine nucleoside permease
MQCLKSSPTSETMLILLYLLLVVGIKNSLSLPSNQILLLPTSHTSSSSPLTLSPKVLILTFFAPESLSWLNSLPSPYNLTFRHRIPGSFSPFPYLHCSIDNSLCLYTTGMGEINAAVSASELWNLDWVDWRQTYVLSGGVGGGDPGRVTLGSVAFPKFALLHFSRFQF